MKITVITISNVALNCLVKIHEDIEEGYPKVLDLKLYNGREKLSLHAWERLFADIEDSDVVLIDLMGAPMENYEKVAKACSYAKGNVVPIGDRSSDIQKSMRLGKLTMKDMGSKSSSKGMDESHMKKMNKMMNMSEKLGSMIPVGILKDMKNLSYISKYWTNSTEEDFKNLLYLLMRDYGNIREFPKPKEPIEVENINFYSFERKERFRTFKEFSEVMFRDEEKPNLLFMFSGYNYPTDTMSEVEKIYRKFKKDFNILPLVFPSSALRRNEELEEIIRSLDIEVELIINFLPFRLGAGPMGGDVTRSLELLRLLNVPLLHPFFMTRKTKKQWENSVEGLNTSEFLVSIMLPELDGAIDMIPVGALDIIENKEKYGVTLTKLNIIEERVEKLRELSFNLVKLRRKENRDKRVAIVCYNYPPGEANIFGGAFLDTFKSIENILERLKEEDYDVEPIYSKALKELFINNGIVNSPRWKRIEGEEQCLKYSSEKYSSFLNTISHKKKIIEQWGEVPGDVMSSRNEFLIPGIVRGKVFIGLQPSRGVHENPEKLYHNKELLPHHQYLAFYNYIKEEFKADVIIHVGTHGTLEFLRGKECGVSGECFPDILIGDIPHLYLYYVGNPSEAMIAKRRSLATLIGYKPPMFIESDLYGEFTNIENLFHKYYEAERLNPILSKDIVEEIKSLSLKNNLPFNSLEDIEKELYRMKNSLIPKGLHIFGEAYSREEAINYIREVLSFNRPSGKSLNSLMATLRGENYEDLLKENKIEEIEDIKEEMKRVISSYISHGELILEKKFSSRDIIGEIEEELKAAKILYNEVLYSHEFSGLLKGLSSEYIPSKLAGDIIRSPESMPTGYNLHQFDPFSIPSIFAFNRGVIISQNTLENYKNNNSKYPESIASVLWGLETSRTGGETLGQILWYLGVRFKTNSREFKNKFEIIPLEELKRPRIDVVVNICGFFRDMFPNIMEELTRLFVEISSLDENDNMNYVKKHSKIIYNELLEEGYCKEEASELSTARLFGPAEGEYGTKVTSLIETKSWESEEDIGKSYIDSLNHVYSPNYRGKKAEKLFKNNLSVVDIVSQIRSNHEYEITDLDHYYEFFGGLSKSVEISRGKKAEMYITDTTGEEILTEDVEKSINRGVRTRLLNPKWIEGLLEHDYHAGSEINKRFENILGLSATTNKVENWVYDKMFNTYIKDEELRGRLKENNKWAYMEMLNFMLEYENRGYWNPKEDQKEELIREILKLEGELEE